MLKRALVLIPALLSIGAAAHAAPLPAGRLPSGFLKNRPKLVVLLVIDQFRSDYIPRVQAKFLPAASGAKLGGFNYLIERGAYYPQAQYDLLQNMTGPGHATMLTGAYPYLTGVPINEWYDRKTKKAVYCVGDAAHEWISGKPPGHAGTSPENLGGSTLGDELKSMSGGSRVVAISLKDRSSILMGGRRADAAIWMDPLRFQWTSTKYYFPDGQLPDWVVKANARLAQLREQPVTGISNMFPGGLKWADKSTAASPAGLELTSTLAESAIAAYGLGKGKATDLLAVSISSHDYAGHTYGPGTQAMDEMTIAEDVALSKLFNYLQKNVPGGMKNVLVVLTADHGVAPNPETAKMAKLDAGRIDEQALKKALEKDLQAKFGKVDKQDWIAGVAEMNVYLNPAAIADKKLDPSAVEEAVKAELLKVPGVSHAFTYTDYQARRLPPGFLARQVLNTYYPGRSGDVVAIVKPFFISSDDTAGHQSGWAYDRTVPLLFAGPNVRAGAYASPAEIVDIAPTLAFLLGTVPPSQSHGRVLSEMLGGDR